MKRKTDLVIILYPGGRNQWDLRGQVSHWWGSEGRREEEQMTGGGEGWTQCSLLAGQRVAPFLCATELVSHFRKKKKGNSKERDCKIQRGGESALAKKKGGGGSPTKANKRDENPFKCLWPNLSCFMNQWSSTSSEILVLHNFRD